MPNPELSQPPTGVDVSPIEISPRGEELSDNTDVPMAVRVGAYIAETNKQHPILTKLTAALTAVALGLSIGAALPSASDGKPAVSTPTCPRPSPEAITAVTELLDHPPQLPHIGEPISNNLAGGIVRHTDPALMDAERKLGLTYPHIDTQEFDTLEKAPFEVVGALPFSEYSNFTTAVLAQAGVTLHIGPSSEEAGSAKMPTQAELETTDAKFKILELGMTFANQSLQEDKQSGLRQINVTAHAGVDAGHPNNLLGSAQSAEGVVQFDITNSKNFAQSKYVMEHERFHIRDAQLCGSPAAAQNDPYYASLNVRTIYRNTESPQKAGEIPEPPTYEDVVVQYNEMMSAYVTRFNLGDIKDSAEIKKAADRTLKDAEVMDNYSDNSGAEDKANIGKYLDLPSEYQTVLDKRTPIIRKKFLTIMARMYMAAPEVVKDLVYRYGRFAYDERVAN